MANRHFVAGGVDNLWSTIGNWSLTAGGAGGQAVPTSSDDVFLSGTSPNCTVNSGTARVCRQFDCNGYTNTLTMNVDLTCTPQTTGIFRLAAGMSFSAGGGTLICSIATSGSCTLTSAGITVGVPFSINGNSSTGTLADAFTVGAHLMTFAGAGNLILNGNSITFAAGLAGGSGSLTGTTTLTANGIGAFTKTGRIANNLTINTAGTITITTLVYGGGTLTYTTGTVVTSGSTVTLGTSGTTTLNTNGITWVNITTALNTGTMTLTSDMTQTGNLVIGTSNSIFNGQTWNVGGSLTNTQTVTGTTNWKLTGSGNFDTSAGTFRCSVEIAASGTITFVGTWANGASTTVKYTSGTVAYSGTVIWVNVTGPLVYDLGSLVFLGEIRCITVGTTLQLASAMNIGNGGKLTLIGTAASPVVLNSTSGGVQRDLVIHAGAIIDVGHVTMTDLDCSDGGTLWVYKGSRSNCTNISTFTPYTSPLGAFAGGETSSVFG